jgi:hypothetical protein
MNRLTGSSEAMRNQVLGLALAIFGILANNYIYLHDLVWDRHDGAIFLGAPSLIAAAMAAAVAIAGILLVARAPAERPADQVRADGAGPAG